LEVKCECKYPIDEDLCTLCGKCIFACPLDAIDDEISIDFTKCDYCGKCVNACPENAIDLYRYKNYNFSVPQVLFLDDNKSKNEYFTIKGVYHIDEKEELFANIGTFQIEQSVNHNSEICQYNGRLDLGCERCIEVCEYKAIHKSSMGIEVDHLHVKTAANVFQHAPQEPCSQLMLLMKILTDLIYKNV